MCRTMAAQRGLLLRCQVKARRFAPSLPAWSTLSVHTLLIVIFDSTGDRGWE